MSAVSVFHTDGSVLREWPIDEACLERQKGAQAVKQAVVAHAAALRSGTASTLGKGAVAGSNRKPWKQKGTGRARAGYRQSPVWRGGGAAFGPKPRDYTQKVNRKMARLAFRRALSDRVAEGAVSVVEQLAQTEPRTRTFAGLLKSLGLRAPLLVVVGDADANLLLAVRNLQRVEVMRASDVHTWQLVRYPRILADVAGMEALAARLRPVKGEA